MRGREALMKRTPLILTIFLIAGLSISVLASDVSALTIYQGIMTLEVKGEREWISSFVGEYYGPDDHFRTTCRELIQITVPSFYISMGLVADQSRPSVVVASAEYKCFKNGNLVEYWDCPEQQVPPLHPLASYGAVVWVPGMAQYYVLYARIPLAGEHAVFNEGWVKEQATYYTHEIQLPDDSPKLAPMAAFRLPF
jgi:hypothetical protein